VSIVSTSKTVQFDDMRMAQEFQVLNLALHSIICVSAQFSPIDEFEGNELLCLLMLSDCISTLAEQGTSDFAERALAERLDNAEIA
jgi:hypothetical protein